MRGVLSSLSPVSHSCGFVPGPPLVAPRGPGRVTPTPPILPPKRRKLVKSAETAAGGGSDTVTALMSPLHVPQVLPSPLGHGPTAALPLTRATRGDNAKIFPSPPPSCPHGPWSQRGAERPRARHTELRPLPVQPSHTGLGVPPGPRGLRRGVQGEPARFLSSGVDSCRASCGFPLHSPPGAVTPSTHTQRPG